MYLFLGFGLLMAAVSLFSLFFALTHRASAAHWVTSEAVASIVAYLVTAFIGVASVLFAQFFSQPQLEQVVFTPLSMTVMLVIAALVAVASLRAILYASKPPVQVITPQPIQPRSPQRPAGNGRAGAVPQSRKRAA